MFEGFYTILAQIEELLNSITINDLSNDSYEFQCMTRGDFLIGAPLIANPENRLNLFKKRSEIL